jgi:hypothetical protein
MKPCQLSGRALLFGAQESINSSRNISLARENNIYGQTLDKLSYSSYIIYIENKRTEKRT